VEKHLVSKEHPFLLSAPQHKGNCYILYTVWYINALYSIGRVEESRKLFEEVLSCCNGCGTVGETIDPKTRYHDHPFRVTTQWLDTSRRVLTANKQTNNKGSCGVTSLTPSRPRPSSTRPCVCPSLGAT
jgi:GH15 family glucan-1,4-alpha-glucosidase